MSKIELIDFLKYKTPSSIKLSPDGNQIAFLLKTIDIKKNDYIYDMYIYNKNIGSIDVLIKDCNSNKILWSDENTILYYDYEIDDIIKDKGIEVKYTNVYTISTITKNKILLCKIPIEAIEIYILSEEKFVLKAETSLDSLNLLTIKDNDILDKEINILLHKSGYKEVTELPYCEDGNGIINRNRDSLFLFNRNNSELTVISEKHMNVNHISIKDNQILYTGFNYTDVMSIYEGLYIYNVYQKSTNILIADYKYSIDFIGFLDESVICLALIMNDYGIYEHPTFILIDNLEENHVLRYDRRISNSVGTDCYSGKVTEQCIADNVLYFISTEGVNGHLCKFTVESGVSKVVDLDISIKDFDIINKEIVLIAFQKLQLPEVYSFYNNTLTQITNFNTECLKNKELSVPKELNFINSDNIIIDGFVMKPIGYETNKKYPTIIHIHGGPKTVFGSIFHHEMQLWASKGYFVVYCNPRGSCGKGNDFADIRGKLGSIDYTDIIEFLDVCIDKYIGIDSDNIAVCGGSYGGFMTNWIIGHTDRFKCAISMRSISDYRSDYLLSDIGYYYIEDQHNSTLWKAEEKLWNDSPLKYAYNIKTPTLFIHSNKDYRCPISNAYELFSALKLNNVDTKLCIFNNESHGLSRIGKPKNRICRMEEILNWFEIYFKK